MENSNSTGKLLATLIVVSLFGAIAGILFAPKKGSRTRAILLGELKDSADELSNKVTDEIHLLKKAVARLEHSLERKVKDMVDSPKDKHGEDKVA